MRRIGTAVVTTAFLLCGCGGGGGGSSPGSGGSSGAAPTPTPASSPTPSPEGFNASLVDLRYTQQFNGYHSTLQYDRLGNAAVSGLTGFDATAAYNPIYNVDTRTWYFLFSSTRLPGFSASAYTANPAFAPSNRIAAQSTGGYNVWQSAQNGSLFTFTLLEPATNNPQLALRYASIGLARGTSATSGSVAGSYDTRAFSFGIPSEQNQIASQGSATYTGIVIGEGVGENLARVYRLSGTTSIKVDYAAQTFSGSVTLRGTSDTGETVTFPPIVITQPTARLDTLIGYVGAGTDSFRGSLAGPAAEELYGSFRLTIHDPAAPSAQLTVVVGLAAKH